MGYKQMSSKKRKQRTSDRKRMQPRSVPKLKTHM